MFRSNVDINYIFSHYPNDEFWKIIIDGEKWKAGPDVFDNDKSKGYLNNVGTALYFMLLTVNMPLSVPFMIALHDLAYHQNKFSLFDRNRSVLGLSPTGESGIERSSFTESLDSLVELIDKIKLDNIQLYFSYMENCDNGVKHLHEYKIRDNDKPSQDIALELLNIFESKKYIRYGLTRNTDQQDAWNISEKYLQRLNIELSQAKSDKDKVLAIVRYIQNMHQYHPFEDGNGRLFVFLLLNKLLIQNHLDPALIESPGRFTGYDLKSLVKEVENGQAKFREMTKTTLNKPVLFLDYLHDRFKVNPELEQDILSKINIQQAYQDVEKREYIHKNITKLVCNHFCGIYDRSIIDFIISNIPPTDPHDYIDMLITSLGKKNYYLSEKILFTMPQDLLDMAIFAEFLCGLPPATSEKFWDKAAIDAETTYDVLTYDQSDIGEGHHFLFRNLLINNKADTLDFLLCRLTPVQLDRIFTLYMYGFNGLQFIAMCNLDLYKKFTRNMSIDMQLTLLEKKPEPFIRKDIGDLPKFMEALETIKAKKLKVEKKISISQSGLYSISHSETTKNKNCVKIGNDNMKPKARRNTF